VGWRGLACTRASHSQGARAICTPGGARSHHSQNATWTSPWSADSAAAEGPPGGLSSLPPHTPPPPPEGPSLSAHLPRQLGPCPRQQPLAKPPGPYLAHRRHAPHPPAFLLLPGPGPQSWRQVPETPQGLPPSIGSTQGAPLAAFLLTSTPGCAPGVRGVWGGEGGEWERGRGECGSPRRRGVPPSRGPSGSPSG